MQPTLSFLKSAMVLRSGAKLLHKPHDFNVAVAFFLQFSAGSHLVEIAVNIEFEKV